MMANRNDEALRALVTKWREIAADEIGDAYSGPWEECADDLEAALLTPRPEPAEAMGGEDANWRELARRAWNLLDVECPNAAITAELFAALSRPVAGGDGEFEVWQDDQCVAGASGPRDRALGEAMHYAHQYAADGDVEVHEITRTTVCEIATRTREGTEGEGNG